MKETAVQKTRVFEPVSTPLVVLLYEKMLSSQVRIVYEFREALDDLDASVAVALQPAPRSLTQIKFSASF